MIFEKIVIKTTYKHANTLSAHRRKHRPVSHRPSSHRRKHRPISHRPSSHRRKHWSNWLRGKHGESIGASANFTQATFTILTSARRSIGQLPGPVLSSTSADIDFASSSKTTTEETNSQSISFPSNSIPHEVATTTSFLSSDIASPSPSSKTETDSSILTISFPSERKSQWWGCPYTLPTLRLGWVKGSTSLTLSWY
jgi:hypothetical protein